MPSSSALRLSAGPKRLRRFNTFVRPPHELIDLDLKDAGKAIKNVDRRVRGAPLDVTQVGRRYAGIDSQNLLREATSGPQMSHIPRDARSSIHGPQAQRLPALIHELYDK